MVGCEGLFYALLLTLATALATYNILATRSVTGATTRGALVHFNGVGGDHPFTAVVRRPRKASDDARAPRRKRPFHTALTATGEVYSAWQSRVMYYWYKQHKDGPGSDMGGFTRILHSGKPDAFMDEIPTFVAQPLPEGEDKQGYVVLNRPWAFVQWLRQANIPEDYILMAEPDHLIVKPIPNLSSHGLAAAFPFNYINPMEHERILRRYYPKSKGPITDIDPIGNSPVIIKKKYLKKIAPTWMNVSLAMKNDPEADKVFGWVLEMYGYAVASALHGVQNSLHRNFMIHPPWEREIGQSYIIHYTFGCDYTLDGEFTPGKYGAWRFDKRNYTQKPPPRNLAMPPDGVPESVVSIIKMVNRASASLPGWDAWSAA